MANLYTTKTDGIDIVYAADVNELQAGVGFATEPGGRLTLETGVPVSASDQSAKTTLYYTAYTSNRIPLYSGSAWQLVNFTSDLSISLVGTTASLPYDVFCYNNNGTATLELTAWTNTTTRATALTRQDGRYVKTGATTRLYLGTIYTDAAGGACTDSFNRRGVYNAYNRISRTVKSNNTTASWTYSSTIREYNGGTGQVRGEFVLGLATAVLADSMGYAVSSTFVGSVGWSIDSVASVNGEQIFFTNAFRQSIKYVSSYSRRDTTLAVGYHYLTQLEVVTSGTMTNNGNSALFSAYLFVEM